MLSVIVFSCISALALKEVMAQSTTTVAAANPSPVEQCRNVLENAVAHTAVSDTFDLKPALKLGVIVAPRNFPNLRANGTAVPAIEGIDRDGGTFCIIDSNAANPVGGEAVMGTLKNACPGPCTPNQQCNDAPLVVYANSTCVEIVPATETTISSASSTMLTVSTTATSVVPSSTTVTTSSNITTSENTITSFQTNGTMTQSASSTTVPVSEVTSPATQTSKTLEKTSVADTTEPEMTPSEGNGFPWGPVLGTIAAICTVAGCVAGVLLCRKKKEKKEDKEERELEVNRSSCEYDKDQLAYSTHESVVSHGTETSQLKRPVGGGGVVAASSEYAKINFPKDDNDYSAIPAQDNGYGFIPGQGKETEPKKNRRKKKSRTVENAPQSSEESSKGSMRK